MSLIECTQAPAEFREFSKIGRLSREIIVTEKIDGTNAQVLITEDGRIFFGSRTRWITPADDNFGFARWATEHTEEIMKLGVGRHYGEWWGSGIQRGYGLPKGERRFSLFNVSRWCLHGQEPAVIETQDPRIAKVQDVLPGCVGLVPILYRGIFSEEAIERCLEVLRLRGSYAAPNWMNPEGVVVFHTSNGALFKKTLEHDDVPKSKIK